MADDVELAFLIGVHAADVVTSVFVLEPLSATIGLTAITTDEVKALGDFSLKGGGDGDEVAVEDDALLVMVEFI